ncbi:MAG: hypothetical protein EBV29_10945, partial [Gammaproteobacteria bacterium]|nr:hypothetical protein [Gammaproteobacteria bacterium]
TLTKSGTGSLTFGGANTYTGSTTVSAGSLVLSGSGGVPDGSAMSIAGTFNLAGISDTVGSVAGAGSIALGSGTLTTGGDNSSTSFTGVISGTSGRARSPDPRRSPTPVVASPFRDREASVRERTQAQSRSDHRRR